MTATSSQIADALAGLRGPVTIRWKFQRRDHDYAFIDDLVDDYDAVVADTGELSVDNDRDIMQSFSGLQLIANRLPADFDPTSDHLAIIAQVRVNGEWVDLPMGLYHLDVSSQTYTPDGELIYEVEGSSVMVHLYATAPSTPYYIASATNIKTAIETILDLKGINHSLPTSSLTTPVARTWPAGTSYGDILADLCAAGNFTLPYLGSTGVATVRSLTEPALQTANVEYSTEEEPRMIEASEFRQIADRSRYHNLAAGVIAGPSQTISYVEYENDDADSPIATSTVGDHKMKDINGAYAADTTTLRAIVKYALWLEDMKATEAELETRLDPRRGAQEFYTLTIDDHTVDTLWRVHSWSMPMSSFGTMKHQLQKVNTITLTQVA